MVGLQHIARRDRRRDSETQDSRTAANRAENRGEGGETETETEIHKRRRVFDSTASNQCCIFRSSDRPQVAGVRQPAHIIHAGDIFLGIYAEHIDRETPE